MNGKQAICVDCGEKYIAMGSAKRCMTCRDERMVNQEIERKRQSRLRTKLRKKNEAV